MKAAIAGATGLVGREMLSVLQESNLSISSLKLFASENSRGETLGFRGSTLPVEIIKKSSLEKGMIILGATSSDTARLWVPIALEAGATVIDNSSAYRMNDDVPLVVPQVNPDAISNEHRLIANPNCSTIQLVMALAPLRQLAEIAWVSVSTYQSVSGAGREGIELLKEQEDTGPVPGGFHRNVVCEIGDPGPTGYTEEELKLVNETVKILGCHFQVFPACARVPVAVGHTESVTVSFKSPVSSQQALEALSQFPGVVTVPRGPQPLEVEGTSRTFVGRVRNHPAEANILQFWVTADNVRKGAALNAVEILELIMTKKGPGDPGPSTG